LGIGLARKGQNVLIVGLGSQASQAVSLGWKQPEYLSVIGMTQLFDTVAVVKKQINPALKVEGVLITHLDFIINRRRGELRKLDPIAKEWEMHIENRKSATRCKVEHTFLIIKRDFGFKKVRYRGLAKTLNQWYMAALSANLVMLGRAGRVVAPLTA